MVSWMVVVVIPPLTTLKRCMTFVAFYVRNTQVKSDKKHFTGSVSLHFISLAVNRQQDKRNRQLPPSSSPPWLWLAIESIAPLLGTD